MGENHSPSVKQLEYQAVDRIYGDTFKRECRIKADYDKKCSCQYRSCGDDNCQGDCGCLLCLNSVICNCKCKCIKCR